MYEIYRLAETWAEASTAVESKLHDIGKGELAVRWLTLAAEACEIIDELQKEENHLVP